MADVNCAVCREPWDSYGVTHGDMLPWESVLFRKGAGCPSCEGIPPAGSDQEANALEHARTVITDSEDPHAFDLVNALPDVPTTRAKWERPEDPTLGTCAGCDLSVKRDQDTGDLYWGGKAATRPGARRHLYDPEEDPAASFPHVIADQRYCELCAQTCDCCSESVIFRDPGTVDTYDQGSSFLDQRSSYMNPDVICVGCYEAIPHCDRCGPCADDTSINDQGLCEDCAPDQAEEDPECPACEGEDPRDFDLGDLCADCQRSDARAEEDSDHA